MRESASMVPIPTDPQRALEDESVYKDVTASSSLTAGEVFLFPLLW
jgi:hypothetical protein